MSAAQTLLISAYNSHVLSKLKTWLFHVIFLDGYATVSSTCFGFGYIGLSDFLMWYTDLAVYDMLPLCLYYNLFQIPRHTH